jgi:hypothetical protein
MKKPVNYTEIYNYLKAKGKPTLVGVDSNSHGKGGYNEIYFVIIDDDDDISSVSFDTGFNADRNGIDYEYQHSWKTEYKGNFYILDDNTEKTIDDVEYGDILVNVLGKEYKVLARLNELVFLSHYNGFDKSGNNYTITELKNSVYTLKKPTPEPKILEVTLEEVAQKFGVKDIKIIEK